MFYDIAIEPIKVQTCLAFQNVHMNLSFVKDTYGNAKKMASKGGKMVVYESQVLRLTLYICFYPYTSYFCCLFKHEWAFKFKPFFPGKRRIWLKNCICSPRFMNQIGLDEINWIKLDQTRSNQNTPNQIDFTQLNVPKYVVIVPTMYM